MIRVFTVSARWVYSALPLKPSTKLAMLHHAKTATTSAQRSNSALNGVFAYNLMFFLFFLFLFLREEREEETAEWE